MEPIEVLGVEHIDLSVSRLDRAVAFYDKVLTALGFRRIAGEHYVAWTNGLFAIGLRPASADLSTAFDRRRVGLHHLALKARSRQDVDRLHEFLIGEGLPVLDAPAEYPQYGAGFYALYFADPDGMKLEFAHYAWGYWRRVQTEGADPRPRFAAKASA